MRKCETPFRFSFNPRPLINKDEFAEYLIMYIDKSGKYHFETNLTDPVKIAGFKGMIDIAYQNTFLDNSIILKEN